MGLLKGLILAGMDTAMLPVKIVQDMCSLGGVVNDKKEPYTVEQLKKIREDIADSD